jgi:quinol monooxygenase YgiN
MPFMLKIRWDIKDGSEPAFRANQEAVCKVMLEHPGVIAYHVEYPAPGVSEWTEIYATDAAFKAHLDDEQGKAPLGEVIEASEQITCRCFGDPNDVSREILAGFGTTYHETAANSFVLHPLADKDSPV